jgi:hypothetical protein
MQRRLLPPFFAASISLQRRTLLIVAAAPEFAAASGHPALSVPSASAHGDDAPPADCQRALERYLSAPHRPPTIAALVGSPVPAALPPCPPARKKQACPPANDPAGLRKYAAVIIFVRRLPACAARISDCRPLLPMPKLNMKRAAWHPAWGTPPRRPPLRWAGWPPGLLSAATGPNVRAAQGIAGSRARSPSRRIFHGVPGISDRAMLGLRPSRPSSCVFQRAFPEPGAGAPDPCLHVC